LDWLSSGLPNAIFLKPNSHDHKTGPKKTEIFRKIVHILFGIAIIAAIKFEILQVFSLFILLALSIVLSFIAAQWKPKILVKFLDAFGRKESIPGKGFITYLIGSILAIKLFPQDIAFASIMVLALGDGLSTITGIALGRTKTFLSNRKLLEGTLIGIVVGALGASYFVEAPEAIVAAIIAMGLEATEIKLNNKLLSDNILVPLAAGTSIILFRLYF